MTTPGLPPGGPWVFVFGTRSDRTRATCASPSSPPSSSSRGGGRSTSRASAPAASPPGARERATPLRSSPGKRSATSRSPGAKRSAPGSSSTTTWARPGSSSRTPPPRGVRSFRASTSSARTATARWASGSTTRRRTTASPGPSSGVATPRAFAAGSYAPYAVERFTRVDRDRLPPLLHALDLQPVRGRLDDRPSCYQPMTAGAARPTHLPHLPHLAAPMAALTFPRAGRREHHGPAAFPPRLRSLRRPANGRARRDRQERSRWRHGRPRVHLLVRPPVARSASRGRSPVALAVEAAVRLFKQVGVHQLLGQAVKVSGAAVPLRIHRVTKQASETLGIAMPQVFLVNSPVFNAGTLGTNDDSFIVVHSSPRRPVLRRGVAHGHPGTSAGHIHNPHVAYLTALHYLTCTWRGCSSRGSSSRRWWPSARGRAGPRSPATARACSSPRTSPPPSAPSRSSRSARASSTKSSTSTPSSSSTKRAPTASASTWRSSRRTRGSPSACWRCGPSATSALYRLAIGAEGGGGTGSLTMTEVDEQGRPVCSREIAQ